MTTLYVDNIAPNLQSKISAPNLTLPSGSVIQVVQGSHSSTASTTSSTYTDTGLSVSITPTSTSSKILLIIHNTLGGDVDNDSGGTNQGKYKVVRTIGGTSSDLWEVVGAMFARGGQVHTNTFPPYLDSPNTTSSITYKTQFGRSSGSANTVSCQANRLATIVAMEIAG